MRIHGLSELIRTFQNADANIDNECSNTVDKIGTELLAKTVLKTPVDTGKLKKSWGYKNINSNEGVVYTELDYSVPVEFGHRNGSTMIDGRYMLTRSVEEIENEIDQELEIIVDNLFW